MIIIHSIGLNSVFSIISIGKRNLSVAYIEKHLAAYSKSENNNDNNNNNNDNNNNNNNNNNDNNI